MSVYRRGKVYHYEFVCKGARFRGSTGKTEREAAKRVEARKRVEAEEGASQGSDGRCEITLYEAAERFYQERARHQASAATTDTQLEKLSDIIGRGTQLSCISDSRIAAFVARRRGAKSRRAPKSHKPACRCERCALSPATVNREIELLRRLMRRARKVWGARVTEPDWTEHLLPEPAERVRELTQAEEAALFDALRPDFHPLVLFCLITGIRKDDAVTLTWKQIDWQTGLIRLKVKSPRPGGQPHTVPMTREVVALLQHERGNNPIHVFTYVCKRSRGKRRKGNRYPFSAAGWSREWRRTLAVAGIEDFRFHDLRHTAATRLLRASNLKIVQKLLGHADIATTARYAHAQVDDVRAAMEAVVPTKSPTVVPRETKKA
jgi:integrase